MGQSVCKCCQCCRHPNGTKTIGDKYPFDTPSNLLSYKRPNGTHSPVGHYRDPETGKLITFSVSAMNIEDMDIYRSAAMKQPIELHQDKSRSAGDGNDGADGSGDNYDPPVFIQKLKDVTIKVGTRAKMEVEISSTTSYKVTWYRNHMQVLAGEEYIVENLGDVHSVEIVCLSVQDGGEWICMAENTSGRIFSSCTIQALVPKAYKEPVFFEELQALLTEDGTVSLECKVVGVPTPTLRWFKDGREIKAGDMFALTANPKDPTSLGTYTCEASNCMGKSYSSSRVTVLGRVGREELKAIHSGIPSGQPPIFTQEMKDEKIKIGESLIVSCQIAVPPWPKSIQWMNAQGPVDTSPGGRYHMLADGLGGYMLEISSLEICDQGTWKCVATSGDNSVAVSKSEITLSIPKNYRKPCFMEKLKAVLTEDGLVSFECKVVGFPTPYLRWFKDGVELKPGDVYQLTGTNSLGSYNCIARNCMGEASSSAELTLEDIRHQLSHEERLQLLSKSQPPKFIRGLKSCEVKINEGFRFTVHVSSPEPTKVEWYRDDTPIKSEPDQYVITKGAATGVFHLDIIKCEFQDQAEWKCLVTNEFGQSETSCFLRLSIPKHFKKPRFLQCLKAVLSKEGTVSLECKVIGVPQPVLKWYKDGAELKPGDIHRIISGQDGTCCLGTYTCEARNCMGVVSSCASLLSLEDYAQPDLPKKKGELLHNLSLSTIHEEGSSVTFGTPASQIFETPPEQQTVNADEQGELSFSFDGKDISVSFYDTPDLTNDEALQIVEMYADQLSEHISEHNVLELPPLRIIRETSTTGNLLMEGVVIDVLPEYFTATEEDLNTEADIEDFSTTSEVSHYKTGSGKSREGSMVSEPKIPKVKSDSSPSAEVFYSLSHSKHSSKESSDDEKSQTRALELETESYMSARSVRNSMEIEEDLSNVFKVDIITEPERDDDIPGSQEPTPVPPRKPRRKNGKGKRRLSHSSSEEKSLTDSEQNKTGKKRKSSKSSEDGKEKLISDDAKVHGLDKGEQAVPEAIKFSDLSEDIKVLQENENYLLDLLRDNLNEIDKRLGIIEEELSVKSTESTSLTTQKSFEILNSIARPIKELRQCVCLKQDTKEKVSVSDIILPTIFDLLQNLNIAQKCMESSRNILVQKTSSRIVEMVDQDLINGLDLITDIVKLENTQMKILSNTAEDTSVLSVIDKVKNTVKDMRTTAAKKKLTKETEQKSESEASDISLQTGKLSALEMIESLMSEKVEMLKYAGFPEQEAKMVENEINALQVAENVIVEKASELINLNLGGQQSDTVKIVEHLISQKKDEMSSPKLPKEKIKIIETQINALQMVEHILTGKPLKAETSKPEIKKIDRSIKILQDIEIMKSDKAQITDLQPQEAKKAQVELQALEVVDKLIIEKIQQLEQFGQTEFISQMNILQTVENIMMEKVDDLKYSGISAEKSRTLENQIKALQIVENIIIQQTGEKTLPRTQKGEISESGIQLANAELVENKLVKNIEKVIENKKDLLQTKLTPEQAKTANLEIEALETVHELVIKKSQHVQIGDVKSDQETLEIIENIIVEKSEELKTVKNKPAQAKAVLQKELNSLQVVKNIMAEQIKSVQLENPKVAKILGEKLEAVEGIVNLKQERVNLLTASNVSDSKKLQAEISSLEVVEDLIKKQSEQLVQLKGSNVGVIEAIACLEEEKINELKTPDLKKAQITKIENELQSLQTVKEVIFSKGTKPTAENKAKVLQEIENVIKDNARVLQESEIKSLDTVKKLINTAEIKPVISEGKEGIVNVIECIVEEKLKDLKTPGLKKAQISKIENELQSLQTVKEVIVSNGAKPTAENKAKVLQEIENVIKDNARVLQESEIKSLDTVKKLINTAEIKPVISEGKEGIANVIESIVEEKLKDLKTPGLKKAQITEIENELQSLQTVKEVIFSKGVKPTAENKAKILQEIENVIKDNAGVLQESEIKSLDTVKKLINTAEIKPVISEGKEGIVNVIESIVEEKLKDLKTPGLKKAQISKIENELQSLQTVKEVIVSNGAKPTAENKAKILQEIENVIKDNAGMLQESEIKSLDTVKKLINTAEIKPVKSEGKEGIANVIECIVEEKLKDLKTPGLKKAQITEIENELQSLQTVKEVIFSIGAKPTTENKAKILKEIENVIKENTGILKEFEIKSLDTVKKLINTVEIKPIISEGKEGIANVIESIVEEKLKDLKTPGLKKAQITEIENELQSLQTVKEVIFNTGKEPIIENKTKVLQEIENVIKENTGILQEFEIKSLDTVKKLIKTAEIKPVISEGTEGIVNVIECIVEEKLKDLKTPGLKKAQITEIENELQSLQTVKEVIFSKGKEPVIENKTKVLQEIENVIKEKKGELKNSDIESLKTVKQLINASEIETTIPEGKVGLVRVIENLITDKLDDLKFVGISAQRANLLQSEINALQTVENIIVGKTEIPPQEAKPVSVGKVEILDEIETLLTEKILELQSPISPEKTQQMQNETYALQITHKVINDNAEKIKQQGNLSIKTGALETVKQIMEENVQELILTHAAPEKLRQLEEDLKAVALVEKILTVKTESPKALEQIEQIAAQKIQKLETTTISNAKSKALKAEISALETVENVISEAIQQENISVQMPIENVIEQLITEKTENLKSGKTSVETAKQTETEVAALKTVQQIVFESGKEQESTSALLEKAESSKPETMSAEQIEPETSAVQSVVQEIITEEIKIPKADSIKIVENLVSKKEKDLSVTKITNEQAVKLTKEKDALQSVEKLINEKLEIVKAIAGDELLTSEDKTSAIIQIIEILMREGMEELKYPGLSAKKVKRLQNEIEALQAVENIILEAKAVKNETLHVLEKLKTEKAVESSEPELQALQIVEQLILEKTDDLNIADITPLQTKEIKGESRALQVLENLEKETIDKLEKTGEKTVEKEINALKIVEKLVAAKTEKPVVYIQALQSVETLKEEKIETLKTVQKSTIDAAKINDDISALETFENIIAENTELLQSIKPAAETASASPDEVTLQIVETLLSEKLMSLSTETTQKDECEISALQAVENVLLEKAIATQAVETIQQLNVMQTLNTMALEKTDELKQLPVVDAKAKKVKQDITALAIVKNIISDNSQNLKVINVESKPLQGELMTLNIVEDLMSEKENQAKEKTLSNEQLEVVKKDIEALQVVESLIKEKTETKEAVTVTEIKPLQTIEEMVIEKVTLLKDASLETAEKIEQQIDALQVVQNIIFEKGEEIKTVDVSQEGINAELKMVEQFLVDKADELSQPNVSKHQKEESKKEMVALVVVENMLMEKAREVKIENIPDKEAKQAIVESSALNVVETLISEKTEELKTVEASSKAVKKVLSELQSLQAVENIILEKVSELDVKDIKVDSESAILSAVENAVKEKVEKLQLERLPSAEAKVIKSEIVALQTIENLLSEKQHAKISTVSVPVALKADLGIIALHVIENLVTEKTETMKESSVQTENVKKVEEALQVVEHLFQEKAEELKIAEAATKQILESMDSTGQCALEEIVALNTLEQLTTEKAKELKKESVSTEQAIKIQSELFALKVAENLLSEKVQELKPYQISVQIAKEIKEGNQALQTIENLVMEKTGELNDEEVAPIKARILKGDLDALQTVEKIIVSSISSKENKTESSALEVVENIVTEKINELRRSSVSPQKAKKLEAEVAALHAVEIILVENVGSRDSRKQETAETALEKPLEEAKVQTVEVKTDIVDVGKCVEIEKIKEVTEEKKESVQGTDAAIEEIITVKDRKETETFEKTEENKQGLKSDKTQQSVKESTEEKSEAAEKQESISVDAKTLQVLENIISEKTETLKHTSEESQTAKLVQEQLIALQIVENLVSEKGEELVTELKKEKSDENRALEIVEGLIDEKEQELTTNMSRLQTNKIKKEIAALQTVENILQQVNITEISTSQPQKAELENIILEKTKALEISSGLETKQVKGELEALKVVENLVEKQLQKIETIENKAMKSEISVVEIIEDILTEKTKEMEQPGLSKAEIKSIKSEVEALKVAEAVLVEKTGEQKSIEDIIQKAKEVLTESKALQTIENLKIEKAKLLKDSNRAIESTQPLEQTLSALKVVESLVIKKQKKAEISTMELSATELVENLLSEKTKELTTVVNKKEIAQIDYEIEALKTVEQLLIEKPVTGTDVPVQKFQVGLQALEIIVSLTAKKMQESRRPNMPPVKAKLIKSNLHALEIVENIVANSCKTIKLKNVSDEEAQKLDSTELTLKVIDNLLEEKCKTSTSEVQTEIQALQTVKRILTHTEELVEEEIRKKETDEAKKQKIDDTDKKEAEATEKKTLEKQKELDETELKAINKKESEEHKLKKLEEVKKKESEDAAKKLDDAKKKEEETKKIKDLEEAKTIEDSKKQEIEEFKKKEIEEAKKKELEKAKEAEEIKKKEVQEAERKEKEEAQKKELEDAKKKDVEKAQKKEREEVKNKELEDAKLKEVEESNRMELENSKKKDPNKNEKKELQEAKEKEVEEVKQKESELEAKQKYIKEDVQSQEISTKEKDDTAEKVTIQIAKVLENIIGEKTESLKHIKEESQLATIVQEELIALQIVENLVTEKGEEAITEFEKKLSNENRAIEIVESLINEKAEELTTTVSRLQTKKLKKELSALQTVENILHRAKITEITTEKPQKGVLDEIILETAKELSESPAIKSKKVEGELKALKLVENLVEKQLQKVETIEQKLLKGEISVAEVIEDILIEKAKEIEQPGLSKAEIKNIENELEALKVAESLLVQKTPEQKSTEDIIQKAKEVLTESKALQTIENIKIEKMKILSAPNITPENIQTLEQNVSALKVVENLVIEKQKKAELSTAELCASEIIENLITEKTQALTTVTNKKEKAQINYEVKALETVEKILIEESKPTEDLEIPKEKFQVGLQALEVIVGLVTQKTQESKRSNISPEKSKILKSNLEALETVENIIADVCKTIQLKNLANEEAQKLKNDELTIRVIDHLIQERFVIANSKSQKEIQALQNVKKILTREEEFEIKQDEKESAMKKELEEDTKKKTEKAKKKEIDEAKQNEQEETKKKKEIEETKQRDLEEIKKKEDLEKENEEAKLKNIEEVKKEEEIKTKEIEEAKRKDLEETTKKEAKAKEIEELKRKELEETKNKAESKKKELEEANQKEVEKTKKKEEETKQKELDETKKKEAKLKEIEEAKQRELEKTKKEEEAQKKEIEDSTKAEETKKKALEETKKKEFEEAKKKELEETKKKELAEDKNKEKESQIGLQVLEFFVSLIAQKTLESKRPNISSAKLKIIKNNLDALQTVESIIADTYKTIKITNVSDDDDQKLKGEKLAIQAIDILLEEKRNSSTSTVQKEIQALQTVKRVLTQTEEIEDIEKNKESQQDDESKNKEKEEIKKKELEEAKKKEQEETNKKKLEENKQKELEVAKQKELEEAKQKELEKTKQKEIEEIKQKELEKAKQKEIEEAKQKELEKAKQKEVEEAKQKELEKAKQKEIEEAKQKELEKAKQKEIEEAKQKELEKAKQKEVEEAKQKELEKAKQKEIEEAKQKELEKAKQKEIEEAKQKELEKAKQKEVEEAKQKELEKAKQKEIEEAKQKELEKAKQKEIEEAKQKELEKAKQKEVEEAKQKELEKAKQKEMEEAKQKELEKAKQKEIEEAKQKELEKANQKEIEEAKQKELEKAKQKEIEEAKQKEIEEAKQKELEKAKIKEIEEAKQKEIEEAKQKEIEEAKQKELEKAKQKEIEEAKQKELEKVKQKEIEEAKQKEIEEVKQKELEKAKQKEIEEAKKKELEKAKQKEIEDAKQKEIEEAKQKETEKAKQKEIEETKQKELETAKQKEIEEAKQKELEKAKQKEIEEAKQKEIEETKQKELEKAKQKEVAEEVKQKELENAKKKEIEEAKHKEIADEVKQKDLEKNKQKELDKVKEGDKEEATKKEKEIHDRKKKEKSDIKVGNQVLEVIVNITAQKTQESRRPNISQARVKHLKTSLGALEMVENIFADAFKSIILKNISEEEVQQLNNNEITVRVIDDFIDERSKTVTSESEKEIKALRIVKRILTQTEEEIVEDEQEIQKKDFEENKKKELEEEKKKKELEKIKKKEDKEAEKKKSDEIKKKESEETKKKELEDAKKRESEEASKKELEEVKKKESEEAKKKELEVAKKRESEEARKKDLDEAKKKESEEAKKKELEDAKKRESEEAKKKELEEAKKKETEEAKKKETEEAKNKEIEAKKKESEEAKKKDAEKTKKRESEETKKKELEAKKKELEEKNKKESEDVKKKELEKAKEKELEENKQKESEATKKKETDKLKRKGSADIKKKELEAAKKKDLEDQKKKELEETKKKEAKAETEVIKKRNLEESEKKISEDLKTKENGEIIRKREVKDFETEKVIRSYKKDETTKERQETRRAEYQSSDKYSKTKTPMSEQKSVATYKSSEDFSLQRTKRKELIDTSKQLIKSQDYSGLSKSTTPVRKVDTSIKPIKSSTADINRKYVPIVKSSDFQSKRNAVSKVRVTSSVSDIANSFGKRNTMQIPLRQEYSLPVSKVNQYKSDQYASYLTKKLIDNSSYSKVKPSSVDLYQYEKDLSDGALEIRKRKRLIPHCYDENLYTKHYDTITNTTQLSDRPKIRITAIPRPVVTAISPTALHTFDSVAEWLKNYQSNLRRHDYKTHCTYNFNVFDNVNQRRLGFDVSKVYDLYVELTGLKVSNRAYQTLTPLKYALPPIDADPQVSLIKEKFFFEIDERYRRLYDKPAIHKAASTELDVKSTSSEYDEEDYLETNTLKTTVKHAASKYTYDSLPSLTGQWSSSSSLLNYDNDLNRSRYDSYHRNSILNSRSRPPLPRNVPLGYKIRSRSACGGMPATFVTKPSGFVTVQLGHDITVMFRIDGDPKPKVTVTKGTQDITNKVRCFVENVDDNVRITIKNCTANDMGTYCILIKNIYGSDKSFVTVTECCSDSRHRSASDISKRRSASDFYLDKSYDKTYSKVFKERSRLSSNLSASELAIETLARRQPSPAMRKALSHRSIEDFTSVSSSRSRSGSRASAPVFLTVPHSAVTETGSIVRFQCAISGNPKPTVTWEKGSRTVRPNSRISLKERYDNRILEINLVEKSDAGEYRVILQNEAGRVEACASLNVICINKSKRPVI